MNVEPAVRAGDPLGGHYVQGHVDAVGRIQSVEAEGDGLRVVVEAPPELLRLCVEKGSVAVEGVSCGSKIHSFPVPHVSAGPVMLVIPKNGSYLLLGGCPSKPFNTVPNQALRP